MEGRKVHPEHACGFCASRYPPSVFATLMANECDASYKLLFSSPEFIRELVRGFVPDEWVQSLDYTTLEKVPCHYVADGLRQRTSDVVWRVRANGEWVYLYLLIEFQSTIDRHMAVRIMVYVGLLYQEMLRTGEVPADDPLPPVLPIVLYTGNRKWSAATDIAALIAQMPGPVAKYQPRLEYLLIDRSEYKETDLLEMKNLVACVIGLEHPTSAETLPRMTEQIQQLLGSNPAHRQVFKQWFRGLISRQSKNPLVPPALAAKALEELEDFEMTWAQCFEAARAESEQKGIGKGEAKMLRRVLTQRFGQLPPDIDAKINAAPTEQIEGWADRLLLADTLVDVFRP
jgi:hypothetical protein